MSQNSKLIISSIILALGANYAFAQSGGSQWVAPSDNPPLGNASAPINVSDQSQEKEGPLTINDALAVYGKALFDDQIIIRGGSPALNFILTSTDAEGTAEWKDIADVLNDAGTALGGGESVGSGVPDGAVMNFDLEACPAGWSPYTKARGRYIVGTPSGGANGVEVGNPLTNGQNVATGEHGHGTHSAWTAPNYAGAQGWPSLPVIGNPG
ncbi:MAG: hypothetical protein Q8P93_04270, partial [bacterium]|nr:hypothetical protein [bacterium]